jgi:hypothetical protein
MWSGGCRCSLASREDGACGAAVRARSSGLVLRVPMPGPGGHADISQAMREGPLRAETDPQQSLVEPKCGTAASY